MWSLLDPAAWFQCWGYDAGKVYENAQYGHIPRAGELPQPPAPGVPAGALSNPMEAGSTPGITAADQAAWIAAQQAALGGAAGNGSWNPAGNMPVTAEDVSKVWADHSTAIIIGALAVSGLILWKVRP